MQPYYAGGGATLYLGDCRAILPELPAQLVDAVVTDPPYELGFMGKAWDRTGVAFQPETWRAGLRCAKPGAHLLAFGGTRTYHRLVCAIEDAGWEIRDCLAWMHGQGFPKSHNLRGDWDGWGTALKPGFEPIVLARAPLSEPTVAANCAKWGTGALNIGVTRIGVGSRVQAGAGGWVPPGSGAMDPVYKLGTGAKHHNNGRWPANVLLSCELWCDDAAHSPTCPVGLLDTQAGARPSGVAVRHRSGGNTFGGTSPKPPLADMGYGDSANVSRFFYVSKPSAAERSRGLPAGERNGHPTVKPINLCRWLVRLITPPGGTVLDPFMGSASIGCAALAEVAAYIGIEQHEPYLATAVQRLGAALPLDVGA